AVGFGLEKMKVDEGGDEFEGKGGDGVGGCDDLWFITDLEMESLVVDLGKEVVGIEEGGVRGRGRLGGIECVYMRDGDVNLIEMCGYIEEGDA
ncbi:VOC family protein, partial [Bacillus sp. WP8]|uniref:VOC family protein n=1 Tax=Bacillus sp. WP8 TaxID=756828 RepID=UPI0016423EFF